jgi:probable HAF family extracellular repeat protein
MRTAILASVSAVAILSSTFGLQADDKTILIELDQNKSPLPSAVSASGAVVAGVFNGGNGGFYWMPTTGVIFAGGIAADAVSRDGKTIVGWATDPNGIQQAAIWVRATEWKLLGSFTPSATPCSGSLGLASGTSGDGQVVVGYAYDGCTTAHAFRWQASTGMADLGSTVPGKSSQALGVSGDGHVVVGLQNSAALPNQGAFWIDGRQQLVPGPDGSVGVAYAANNDGSVIVGRICHPLSATDQSAWIWRAQGGTTCLPPPKLLESPGPSVIVDAKATSDDGQVVGGSQNVGGSTDSNAIIWIGGRGAYLKDFLQANGLPNAFRGWFNTGDHRHFARRAHHRRLRRRRWRLPRIHRDPRIEPNDPVMRTLLACAAIAILSCGSPAFAQSWEASALFGFTPSATIDRRASELSALDIRGAYTWGVQGARLFTPSWGAEVLWTQQSTALEVGTADGKADLFSMRMRQLDGNIVYQFGRPDAPWRPFVFGGLGATFFSADTVNSETKFALDVGAGVKFFPSRRVGVRAHVRYKPTLMHDTSSGDFCDPFGFCQNVLQQVEFAAAAVVRF